MHLGAKDMRTSLVTLVVSSTMIAGGAGSAVAAPQILALLETPKPVEMICKDGQCTALLSSYCLQVERYAPKSGMRLHLAKGGKVTLHVRRADGRVVTVAGAAVARFVSARKEYAVRVSVPMAVIGGHATAVSVSIGAQASLIPAKIAGDPQPHKPGEIRKVTTQDRLAGRMVERGQHRTAIAAAHILNRLINRMEQGASLNTVVSRWVEGGSQGTSIAAAQLAAHHVGQCALQLNKADCLAARHDNLMLRFNLSFWRRGKDAGL